MSASILVLDLIRAHYRGDEQAFKAFALRLARSTKTDTVRATMLEVIEKPRRSEPFMGSPRDARFQPPTIIKPVPSKAQSSSLVEPLPMVSIDELLLDDSLRSQIDEIVLEIAHRDELDARGLRPRCRLLFEGPPGNGKTSTGAAIANELGIAAFGVSIPSLVSKWLGETGQNLGKLFAHIEDGALVVFDELDAIGGARKQNDTSAASEQNTVVNTMLTLLDRNVGGTLIATTNRADVMDPALLRRFDEIITFPGPDRQQMATLSARLEEKHQIGPVDLTGCENFDAVHKRVLREARRSVMAKILALKADQSEELTDDDEAVA